MQAKRVPYEQQLQLIMECRQSGLSDYQWCQEHNINPGTFYNWVSRHRKKTCEDIPNGNVTNDIPGTVPHQEVVRIDPKQLCEESFDQPAVTTTECVPIKVAPELPGTTGHAMEIVLNGAVLRISNDISPGLLSQTLRILKGISC